MKYPFSAIALAAGLLSIGAQASAATYTINFDDLAAGTTLSSQYGVLSSNLRKFRRHG